MQKKWASAATLLAGFALIRTLARRRLGFGRRPGWRSPGKGASRNSRSMA
ncbi:hypothetical protein F9C11_34215 [Amycolatopsis sp. VS8301801F10]